MYETSLWQKFLIVCKIIQLGNSQYERTLNRYVFHLFRCLTAYCLEISLNLPKPNTDQTQAMDLFLPAFVLHEFQFSVITFNRLSKKKMKLWLYLDHHVGLSRSTFHYYCEQKRDFWVIWRNGKYSLTVKYS